MRVPILLALVAGLFTGLGQAPMDLSFVVPWFVALALVEIAWATSARRAMLLGWVAGAAQFALVMSWIVEPFLVNVAVHGWMAPFALVLMAGGMALFWAVPAGLGWAMARSPAGRIASVAALLLAAEILRGVLFTGFPWAMLGHVLIDTPMAQLASIGGAPLLSALVLALAALLALGLSALRKRPRRSGAALLAVLVMGGGAWFWGQARLAAPVAMTDTRVRIVQANIPQRLKWQPDLVSDHFIAHLDLSAGEEPVGLVLWPETAAPFFLDAPGTGLQAIADAAQAPVLLGIDRRSRSETGALRYHNSAALIDAQGRVGAVYDKHHLVPFGEYVPLVGAWSEDLGLAGLAARVLSGYSPGPGPRLMDLGDAGRVLPLICYEAIFARSLRGVERPDWVAHLTNDAWFGALMGPQQHLAQTRLRAIEYGLSILRAANTGISAAIDPYGRLIESLDLDQRGAFVVPVPRALPPTPYARMGDAPWYGFALFAGLFGLWRARIRRRA